MKKGKRKPIPFWLQIVIILVVGAIAAGATALIIKSVRQSAETSSGPKYTVTFAYSDGTVIEKKEVESGKGVYPPIPQSEDVFRGWSGPINNVTADKEVHPEFYHIVEDNLFYFDSTYVKEGTEFALNLFLAGKVCASSGSVTLEYDPEVLEYKGCGENGFVHVSEEEKGKLKIGFQSEELLTEKTLLSELRFKALEKDVYSTQVTLSAKEVTYIKNSQTVAADFATINNKIYFLQEV